MTYTTYSDTSGVWVNGTTPVNAANMNAIRSFLLAGWFDSAITSDGSGHLTASSFTTPGNILMGGGRLGISLAGDTLDGHTNPGTLYIKSLGISSSLHFQASDGSGTTITPLTLSSTGMTLNGSSQITGTSSLDNGDITTNGSGIMTLLGLILNGRLNLGAMPTVQALSNNATITLPTSGSIKNISTSASVTGIILSTSGANSGDVIVLVNSGTGGTTLTFAASGSNVRLGNNVTLSAGDWTLCIFDGTNWYVQP